MPALQVIENAITDVFKAFTDELVALHQRAAWPQYKSSALTLRVTYSHAEGGKLMLQCASGWGTEVKAASLGRLMDEVYRRNDFEDREDAAMNMIAIAPPEPRD